jgi:8-hydroxy-5-deazaflavin:NADPH oxidoreductase
MKVGVLGSGTVGQTLGAGFASQGHQVMMGTRDPKADTVRNWVVKTKGASAGSFAEAARFGDFVVLTVLGRAVEEAIKLAGADSFKGKTVIDTTNPIADAPPEKGVLKFTTGPNESLGEKIQALLPGANVVKAYNSVGSARMVSPKFEQGMPTMFLCGDSATAKTQVAEIIRQFGWEPFDCGGIIAARALEPLCMLWCIPGFLNNQWTHAFRVLTR